MIGDLAIPLLGYVTAPAGSAQARAHRPNPYSRRENSPGITSGGDDRTTRPTLLGDSRLHGELGGEVLLRLVATLLMLAWLATLPVRADPVSDGNAALIAGDHNAAVAHYSQAIEAGVLTRLGLAMAFHNRGVAFHQLGDYQRAIQDYDTGLRYQPTDAYVDYTNRGRAYVGLNQHQRAIEDFNTALSLNAGFAEAYFERGLAYQAVGDTARAAQDFAQALALDPGNPEYRQRAQ